MTLVLPILRKGYSEKGSEVSEQGRTVARTPRAPLQRKGQTCVSQELQRLSLQGWPARRRESSQSPASSERSRNLKWYTKQSCGSYLEPRNYYTMKLLIRLSVGLEENPLCRDSISNCNLVSQARLCTYQFYQQLCCLSCSRAKQELEWQSFFVRCTFNVNVTFRWIVRIATTSSTLTLNVIHVAVDLFTPALPDRDFNVDFEQVVLELHVWT